MRSLLMHVDQAAQARHAIGTPHQIVAQQHGEGVVADGIARHQHGMPQAARLRLPHEAELRHRLDPAQPFQHRVVVLRFQRARQFGILIEEVFYGAHMPAGDEDDMLHTGLHRFFHHVIDRGQVRHRQQRLGQGFRGGQHARPPPCDGNDSLSNHEHPPWR
jgi:hypothetical protein